MPSSARGSADAIGESAAYDGCMSTFRLRTPDGTITLGEFDSAQLALESAARLPERSRPADSALEVLVGQSWHEVQAEGDRQVS